MANKRKITLKSNNVLTNDPCYFCGKRTDPDGFDFFAEGTNRLICDQCAIKFSPEMVKIKTEAMKFALLTAELGEGTPTKRTPISKEVLAAFKPPPENPEMDRRHMDENISMWGRQKGELDRLKAKHKAESEKLLAAQWNEYKQFEKTWKEEKDDGKN